MMSGSQHGIAGVSVISRNLVVPVNNKIDARTFGKEVSLSRERDIADIVRYQAQRLSDGVTKRTINHELQVLRMAINPEIPRRVTGGQ